MGYEQIELRADARILVNSENTRQRRAFIYPGRRWSRNSQGLYVAFADEMRADGRRVMCAAMNLQTRQAAGNWDGFDDGFSVRRFTMTHRIRRFNGQSWDVLPLSMVNQRLLSRDGQAEEWSGYGWRFQHLEENHQLDTVLTQRLGIDKWISRFTAGGPLASQYRWEKVIALPRAAQQVTRMGSYRFVNGAIELLGESRVTFHFGANDSLTVNYEDMRLTDVFGGCSADENGLVLWSKPFFLQPGESFEIDPVVTQNAAWSGDALLSSGQWVSSTNFGNSNYFGSDAGNPIRNVARWSLSSITDWSAANTINDFRYLPFVENGLSGMDFTSARTGRYGATGGNDPQTDTFNPTSWSRADLSGSGSGGAWITGQTWCRTTGEKDLDLGTTADSDLKSLLDGGGTTVAIANNTEETSGNRYCPLGAWDNSTSSHWPQIQVDYTIVVGYPLVPRPRDFQSSLLRM